MQEYSKDYYPIEVNNRSLRPREVATILLIANGIDRNIDEYILGFDYKIIDRLKELNIIDWRSLRSLKLTKTGHSLVSKWMKSLSKWRKQKIYEICTDLGWDVLEQTWR